MAEKIYWWETETFAYYRVPKMLIVNPQYEGLSADAALLYGLLLDRMCLSGKNKEQFSDKQGFVFVYFTVKEACESLNCGHDKATKLFCELEQHQLITRKRQGKGKPNRIYVHKFKKANFPLSDMRNFGNQECENADGNNT